MTDRTAGNAASLWALARPGPNAVEKKHELNKCDDRAVRNITGQALDLE